MTPSPSADEEPGRLGMEPLASTREALSALDPSGELDLVERLSAKAARVRDVVPECMGLSITMVTEDLAFTFVASDRTIAALDAVQYLDGGPCASVADDPHVREYTTERLVEQRWRLFAHATAAAGIASTLTVPLRDPEGTVTGSLNFYGAGAHCFDGHHEELAALFAGWAPGAVSNADLSFSTSQDAAETPDRIRAHHNIAVAVGVIASRDGITTDQADRVLRDAAARAGVDPADLAEVVVRSGGHSSRRPS